MRARVILPLPSPLPLLALTALSTSCGSLFFDAAPIDVNVTFEVEPLPEAVAFTFFEASDAPCVQALVDAPTDPDGAFADPRAPLQLRGTDGTATTTQRFGGDMDKTRLSFVVFALSAMPELQGRGFAPIEELETGRGCGERETSADPQTLNIVVRPIDGE